MTHTTQEADAMEAARQIATMARIRDTSPTYPATHRGAAEQELRNLIAIHGETIAMALLSREPDPRVAALQLEIDNLKSFIRGIGINCQRISADLDQISKSAVLPPEPTGEQG